MKIRDLSVNGCSPQNNKLVNTSPTSFGFGNKWPRKQTWANANKLDFASLYRTGRSYL